MFTQLILLLEDEEEDKHSSRWTAISALRNLFSALPPGADEFIALARMMHIGLKIYEGKVFDRIVVDTAATGHTLRLLATSNFIEGFLDKVVQLCDSVQNRKGSKAPEQNDLVFPYSRILV